MRTCLVFCGLIALVALPALAQSTLWNAHASMREVVQLSAAPDAVWAATRGGVFRYAPATGDFERYTLTDGLSGLRAEAVAYDAGRSVVWIGYADGLLDRLDPATGAVEAFRDIARADRFSERSVTRLRVAGDSLFVATSFGVVVFDPVRLEVRDTYSQFGLFTRGMPVRDIAVAPAPDGNGRALWVSTAEGVAVGPLDGRNLQDPASWLDGTAGLPAGGARDFAVFDGKLFVATASDLYSRVPGGGWSPVGFTSSNVLGLTASADVLVAYERFALIVMEKGGAITRLQPATPAPFTFLVLNDVALVNNRIVVADARASLALLQAMPLAFEGFVTPPGPGYNVVVDMVFDPDGTLWTTGRGGNGEGFQRRTSEGTWTVFDRERNPELLGTTADFGTVATDPGGTVWVGSNGAGLVEITPEGAFNRYNRFNSSLRTAVISNPDFIIVNGLGTEGNGTLWATNRFSERPLHVRLPDGTWTGFEPFTTSSLQRAYNGYDRLLVDGLGTKWIALRDERNQRNGRGLIVYDSGRDPLDLSDDAVRHFADEGASGSGLPGTLVTSFAEDRDGRIWIGTNRGIAYILNNGIVARDNVSTFIWPVDPVAGSYVLRNLEVNALAVDPANGLWVGTNEGVWLVQERAGGFETAEHFTMENAPLPSNRVLALEVEPRTGEVYVATENGMVSYMGGVEAPAAQAQALFVYPNPVRAAMGGDVSVTIRGLVEQTDLRILTPGGGVVRQLRTRGGSVVWDGRDASGQLVPSGLYLVVAVGQDGEGAAYGKVAVIR